MTYSIIAHDAATGAVGAATATGSVAVGGFVLHVRYGVGAVATQGAFTNWLYGDRGLDQMQAGGDAITVCERLVAEDDGEAQRQCILCDSNGQTAGHTGRANLAEKHHHCESGLAVAGNMLSSTGVLTAMLDRYETHSDLPLHERLLHALLAGQDQGGDFRGTHSAGIKVHYVDRPPVDLRIDWADHHCVEALWDLYERTHCQAFQDFLAGVPTQAHPNKTGHVSARAVDL